MRLIGSASTLDGLIELLRSRWYWNNVELREAEKPFTWDVYNGGKQIDGVRVVLKSSRYRLEMI